mgnify:CR=1 FL=1
MSAYLNTRVSLYAGRLWQDEDLDTLVGVTDDTFIDTLSGRGLQQLVPGYGNLAGHQQDTRSLEQRIIAPSPTSPAPPPSATCKRCWSWSTHRPGRSKL